MGHGTDFIPGLVSIIVPNYNREDFVETTVRSVIKQTYPQWELLFIDDCSTDKSVELVQKLQNEDSRIRVITTEKNYGGPAGPRNIGIDNAKGEYIAFLDSDDVWHPSKLSVQLELMKKHSVEFCFADIVRFVWDPMLDWVMPTQIDANSIATSYINHKTLLRKNVAANSSVIITRNALGNVRFVEDPRYHAIEDFRCWLDVLQNNVQKALYIHAPLAFYRIHPNAISHEKSKMFKKNFMLYSEYTVNGKHLGLKKYYYLLTYIIISLYNGVKSYRYFRKNKEPFLALLQQHAPKAQTPEHIEQATEMPEANSSVFLGNVFSKRNTPVLFQLLGDIIAVFFTSCLFLLMGIWLGLHDFPRDLGLDEVMLISGLVVIAWITVFWLSGLYTNWYVRSPFDELFTVIRTTFFGCLVLYLIILLDNVFYTEHQEIRLKFFLFWIILVTLTVTLRLSVRIIQRILRRAKIITIPALVLGDFQSLSELRVSVKENPAWGYEIKGAIFSTESESELWKNSEINNAIPSLGTIGDMNPIIGSRNIESLIIAWENPPHPVLLEIAALCAGYKINVKIKPDLYDIFTGRVKTLPIFSSQLIEIQAQILTPWQSFLKRSIDIVFASLFLLLGSPIWLAIALFVKIDSPGPVFYTQNRVGKNGRVFKIYKFRSMSHGASQQQYGIWTSKNDPRVTKFGKFIRKTHLDEVPQMWNVIIGDMSVVGPRPEQPSIVEKYVKVLPIYARRHMVRPGITGWWQIKSRAYEESLAEMQRRLRYDFYYIENLSVKLDIEIILRTVYTVISGHGQA